MPRLAIQQGRKGGARTSASVARAGACGGGGGQQGAAEALDGDRLPHRGGAVVEGLDPVKSRIDESKSTCCSVSTILLRRSIVILGLCYIIEK